MKSDDLFVTAHLVDGSWYARVVNGGVLLPLEGDRALISNGQAYAFAGRVVAGYRGCSRSVVINGAMTISGGEQ